MSKEKRYISNTRNTRNTRRKRRLFVILSLRQRMIAKEKAAAHICLLLAANMCGKRES